MDAPRTSICHVVAMPYPARSHINAMVNICKLLVSKNSGTLVTFVLTQEWLSFLASEPRPDNLRLRSIPNVVPSELTRVNDHLGFMEAVMSNMEAPFEELLHQLEPPPTVIGYDFLLYWVVGVGIRRNIPVAAVSPISASFFSVLHHHQLLVQNGHYPVNLSGIQGEKAYFHDTLTSSACGDTSYADSDYCGFCVFYLIDASSENGDKRVDYIPGISSTRLADFPLNDGSHQSNRTMELTLKGVQWAPKAHYLVFTSIYELEPQAIDALKAELLLPIYTVGPAIPYFSLENNPTLSTNSSHSYLEWLDSQPTGSVLYISQGSAFSVSSAQIDEIAAGLRESGVRFLWVARGEVSRLKEVCGNMGLVVSWCDQLRVLCHPAIGGFWSHCGWNSTKEGVFAGVPFLTSPIVLDQPLDSKMIVEDWKVGWRVKEDVKANTLVKKDEIASLVRRFMDLDSDVAREIRERARKLQQICQHAIANGGSAMTDLDDFVKDIMQTTLK